MKRSSMSFFLMLVIHASLAQDKDLVLWYDKPAKEWNEALPVGNGRLGAMIFGRPGEELIQLNEETLWTGGPVDLNPNPDAPKYLEPLRKALFSDSIDKAVSLLKKMQGPDTEMYQPLGDILIKHHFKGAPGNYYRDLNITKATSATRFTAEGVNYSREVFASAPDQIIVIHLKADRKKALNFSVGVQHELKYQTTVSNDKHLVLAGKARVDSYGKKVSGSFSYEDSQRQNGMRYQFRIKAISPDGKINSTDSSLVISEASEVTLYVSAATSFNGFDKSPDRDGIDEQRRASDYLNAASKKSYSQLLHAHIADYQRYFNRVSLDLASGKAKELPIDQRLVRYREGEADLALEELYFQFGRYLLISSSRPGGIPANLQGIWNNSISPPWRSNFTTNINLQMNYWPAEMTNLSELTEPLTAHIKRMAKNGAHTARYYYNARGWAAHHNSDIWAQTNPVGEGSGDPKWANWSLASPWLSQHLFEHYRFTADKDYLKNTAYPLMKGAADFCLDWLVEKDGILVTAPSTSPENVYIMPNGTKGTVTVASAMDMEIIWDLFTNVIEASEVLGTDREYASLLKQKRAMLSPLKVGKKGNLVEWFGDWEDEDPQHRHISHLFGLHPGRQISPLIDKKFAEASRKTLEVRGDEGTGWSKAWKINFWARMLDGNHAYKMYQELLKVSTLNNLFDTHPPFQIDGNFGATAGITEMLLQSHLNEIQLLPALPEKWAEGHVKGLIARGAFELEMVWKGGKLRKAFVISKAGGQCRLRTNQKIVVKGLKANFRLANELVTPQYITTFDTRKGNVYEITVN
ncbi:alpha-L-fucosidase 2 [Arcticibacter pallidicorallinus]|uniref:Alpha-L-fucosidase 2 n=1 Tax=Arcticibacter pallidicorallinus TaxID=1259464 RepID=A0A2T0UBM4_9SPHI|nr:glycoside hydrolase family 95 protein [Arcticibacter pallidicorallinus]PRY55340.1 alpha-L-fucosidase 2 [Arcticibacter pallidicorallinus]